MIIQRTYLLTILAAVCLCLSACKKEERQIIPEGRLLLSFHKPIFWRTYDSVHLNIETEESFCFGDKPFAYDITNGLIHMEIGIFTYSDCEMMGELAEEIRFKDTEKTYKILVKRPHRQDSASIFVSDSFYVMKSESEEISFKKDTIRRILPNTIWVDFHYCNSTDSARISEIDSGMRSLGAQPKNLTPGDYYYFTVKRDFTVKGKEIITLPCKGLYRVYDFNGDRKKLVDFNEAFERKYHFKSTFDIFAWDKIVAY